MAEKDVVDEIELEVVDDTPPEDQGREPMPKELVKELEEDELEDYFYRDWEKADSSR